MFSLNILSITNKLSRFHVMLACRVGVHWSFVSRYCLNTKPRSSLGGTASRSRSTASKLFVNILKPQWHGCHSIYGWNFEMYLNISRRNVIAVCCAYGSIPCCEKRTLGRSILSKCRVKLILKFIKAVLTRAETPKLNSPDAMQKLIFHTFGHKWYYQTWCDHEQRHRVN